MKLRIHGILATLLLLWPFTHQATSKASGNVQEQAVLIDWYQEGYDDGYYDAVNNQAYLSSMDRPIPAPYFCEYYLPGYNAGWIDGGGATPVLVCDMTDTH